MANSCRKIWIFLMSNMFFVSEWGTHTGGKMNKVHANIASAICKGPAKEAKNKSMLLRPQKCWCFLIVRSVAPIGRISLSISIKRRFGKQHSNTGWGTCGVEDADSCLRHRAKSHDKWPTECIFMIAHTHTHTLTHYSRNFDHTQGQAKMLPLLLQPLWQYSGKMPAQTLYARSQLLTPSWLGKQLHLTSQPPSPPTFYHPLTRACIEYTNICVYRRVLSFSILAAWKK